MAGDYIPMSEELEGRREVAIIARVTGRDVLGVLGSLFVFWLWAQKETPNGTLRGLKMHDLPQAIPRLDLEFFEALSRDDVRWLTVKEDGLVVPHFNRWLGNAAKKRLKERDKKRRQRSAGDAGHGKNLSRHAGDNRGTTAGPELELNVRGITEKKETTLNVGAPQEKDGAGEEVEARAAVVDFMVDEIVREFNDEHSRLYWRKVAGRMHPDDIRRAISETRAEKPSNPRKYLNSRIRQIAKERGVDLHSKRRAA